MRDLHGTGEVVVEEAKLVGEKLDVFWWALNVIMQDHVVRWSWNTLATCS